MDITPIRTKRDYHRALREIEGLMDAKPGTSAGDRLDVLVMLVEAWEAKHYPIDLPDPVEAINRKRPLTLRMVWRLHKGLGIPAESLIKVPDDRAA
jgi:HTH-type transcriptional regulator/antitoxin HigA